ncbi:MAG TPA: cytidine deaminase [Elusimicrobiota bacterium]|nr:cytidine deaminase [Elusimicrobiota bacterium]
MADDKKKLTDVQDKLLKEAARAREKAYAPYSKFLVGAAVLMDSGKIYTGCNVENASYGLTCCAERTAIFKAVSEGEKKIKAIAIVLDAPDYGAPCGACRQVIYEFGPKAEVIMGTVTGRYEIRPITDLIPLAFGPDNL